jgi:hypothetical protein
VGAQRSVSLHQVVQQLSGFFVLRQLRGVLFQPREGGRRLARSASQVIDRGTNRAAIETPGGQRKKLASSPVAFELKVKECVSNFKSLSVYVGLPFAVHNDSAEKRTSAGETDDLDWGRDGEEAYNRDDRQEYEDGFHEE